LENIFECISHVILVYFIRLFHRASLLFINFLKRIVVGFLRFSFHLFNIFFLNMFNFLLIIFTIRLNVYGEVHPLLYILFCVFDNSILRIQTWRIVWILTIVFGKSDSSSLKCIHSCIDEFLWFPHASFIYYFKYVNCLCVLHLVSFFYYSNVFA